MKKILILLLLLISFLIVNPAKNVNAASGGLTFTFEDNYEITTPFEVLPKTYEAVLNIPTSTSSNPGIIFSNLGHNTFEDCYSFEIHYGNKKAYPVLYFDVDNVGDVNIDAVLFEFKDVNVASGSKVQVAITIDTTNPESTVGKCYLNGSLMQTIELTLPSEYNNLNYIPKNTGKLGGCYDGMLGSPYDTVYSSNHFKGELYKFSLYKDSRTADEIARGTNLKDKDILAHYEFSENDKENSITDLSGNNYDIVYSSLWIDKEPAKDYAYSFAVVGDTQSLCELHTSYMKPMYQWIVDNKESKKIEYVLGLGDITEGDHDWEWEQAKQAISLLDGVVPYSIVRGNHDTTPQLNKTFANSTYMSQFNGFYKENDINASYRTLKIGNTDYLFLTLNYGAFDEELAWACSIVEKYPNHKVIISTHSYLYHTGERVNSTCGVRPKTSNDDDYKVGFLNKDTTTDALYNNGNDIWDKLVSKYANIQLVLSGHVSTSHVVTSQDIGIHGNTVTQILANPQDMDKAASKAKVDGYGMICMLYFSADGSQIEVEYYSTVKDKYFMTNNQYTIESSNHGSTAHNNEYKKNDNYHWLACIDCDSKGTREQHNYENACDAICDDCGYTRDINSHVYNVNKYDENHHYKVCGSCNSVDENSIKQHIFDDSCDKTCNNCDYTRTGSHTYETKNYDQTHHWLECNTCGTIDTSSQHKHTFDHDCDSQCNDCEYKRTITHDYSTDKNDGDNYWKECSVCGDKLPVSAPPKKGCGGNIVGTLLSTISLFGVALYFRKNRNSK